MPGAPPFPNRGRKANSVPSTALADAPGDDSALRHTGIRFMGDMPCRGKLDVLNRPELEKRSCECFHAVRNAEKITMGIQLEK